MTNWQKTVEAHAARAGVPTRAPAQPHPSRPAASGPASPASLADDLGIAAARVQPTEGLRD